MATGDPPPRRDNEGQDPKGGATLGRVTGLEKYRVDWRLVLTQIGQSWQIQYPISNGHGKLAPPPVLAHPPPPSRPAFSRLVSLPPQPQKQGWGKWADDEIGWHLFLRDGPPYLVFLFKDLPLHLSFRLLFPSPVVVIHIKRLSSVLNPLFSFLFPLIPISLTCWSPATSPATNLFDHQSSSTLPSTCVPPLLSLPSRPSLPPNLVPPR